MDAVSATSRGAAQTFGAVSQPMNLGQAMNNTSQLENSMRQSNILSTPSSKGNHNDDDFEK